MFVFLLKAAATVWIIIPTILVVLALGYVTGKALFGA